MKGLLIKDFKLMGQQKIFFLGVAAVAVIIILSNDDVIFALGFLTFVVSLFAVSTISYDEFDNGNAFLFTLPITRKLYVEEKYCLGLMLGGVAWALAVLLTVIITEPFTLDIFISELVIIPLMMIIQALTIPFQLKFGADKGRIAIICTIGLLIVIGIAIKNIVQFMFDIDILSMFDAMPALNQGAVIGILVAGAAIILFISMKISISIMKKKEF